jgi:hypothetical protein
MLKLAVGTTTAMDVDHQSLGHLATLVGAPAGYLRTLPSNHVATLLNHGLSVATPAYDDGRVKLLASHDGAGRAIGLRAITSTSYGRVWDVDVAERVMGLAERFDGRLHPAPGWDGTISCYTGDRDTFMLLIDGGSVIEEPNGFGHRPSQLHRGIMVRNSETGAAAFELLMFWFRVICGNYQIHDGTIYGSMSMRHTKHMPSRLTDGAFAASLKRVLDADTTAERAIIGRAMQVLLPAPREERVKWVREKARVGAGVAGQVIDMAEQEEGDSRTLWQVIQGGTAVARDMAWQDEAMGLSRTMTGLLRLAA